MKENLELPPGTSVMVCRSHLILAMEWEGKAGRHVVHLHQTLEWDGDDERDAAITNAVALFRNVIGLEMIEDAIEAGESIFSADDEEAFVDPTDELGR
jgi:hypothetical protein